MASTIQYVGPFEAVEIDQVPFPHGEPVEVGTDVAKALLGRDDFERPKARKKAPARKKAEPKTSEAPVSDDTPAADASDDPPQEG